MGMEESLFPHIRAIKSEDDHEMQEERLICYVAITRAEEVLYITHATSEMLFGRPQSNMPSRFLKEFRITIRKSFKWKTTNDTT
ncbi:3'-5' exonuclease [Staphylococcus aureus]